MSKFWKLATSFSALLLGLSSVPAAETQQAPIKPNRPNILLIVTDDLGYSDLGAFGGEIHTPNLDALVKSGMQLTNFHAAPTCSPSRAMLMSGTDNHIAGLGSMAEEMLNEQRGHAGYEGYLSDRVVAFPALLRNDGYHTYMAGKWHLGAAPTALPVAKGFEESFALLGGGASHFDQRGASAVAPQARYVDGANSATLPKNLYSSEFYTNRLIDNISQAKDDKPFFAYAAYTAPHWPLQAPREYIEKYRGKYDVGYASIRSARMKRMHELGLVASEEKASDTEGLFPQWQDLTPQQRSSEARRMEVYAAMVEKLDFEIGRLIDYLKRSGKFDNTIIFFMADNGAEGSDPEDIWGGNTKYIRSNFDNSVENIGNATSFTGYGPQWATVSETPFRMYKGFTYEGGIRVPAFCANAPGTRKGARSDAYMTVQDLAPTFLQLAGVSQVSGTFEGRPVASMTGTSLVPFLSGDTETPHPKDYVSGVELFGRVAMRKGDMKLVWSNKPWGSDQWELYDVSKDPSETVNLAKTNPQKRDELLRIWADFKDKNYVLWNEEIALKMIYTNQMGHFRE